MKNLAIVVLDATEGRTVFAWIAFVCVRNTTLNTELEVADLILRRRRLGPEYGLLFSALNHECLEMTRAAHISIYDRLKYPSDATRASLLRMMIPGWPIHIGVEKICVDCKRRSIAMQPQLWERMCIHVGSGFSVDFKSILTRRAQCYPYEEDMKDRYCQMCFIKHKFKISAVSEKFIMVRIERWRYKNPECDKGRRENRPVQKLWI